LDDELAVIAMIEVTAAALAAHSFLHGMSRHQRAVLAQAASDVGARSWARFMPRR
jgi:hypothetical protein